MQSEKKTLYLGLDPKRFVSNNLIVHYPMIQIVPRPFSHPDTQKAFKDFFYTHLIFTSRTAVKLFQSYCVQANISSTVLEKLIVITVGKATASLLGRVDFIAGDETAEGVITILDHLSFTPNTHVFYPHAALSRPLIRDALIRKGLTYTECILYDTYPYRTKTLPNLEEFEEIVFTSPSTVEAFITFYGVLPQNKTLKAIGPVTQKVLDKFLASPMVERTFVY